LFGFDRLGAIAVGKDASLLVLDDDPLVDPTALARPRAVLHRGRLVAGEL
jgi:imidazolonepropionase-like amidohydrolase